MAKRRSRGEGSIFKRSDGLWTAHIDLPNGKRIFKYGKSQKDVRDWLGEQQTTVRKGIWADGNSLTVGAFMERYLERLTKPSRCLVQWRHG